MAFTENLAPFFATGDFAVPATLQGVAVNGIFDAEYREPLGGLVEGHAPIFQCAAAQIPSVTTGQTLIVNGSSYTVRGVEPDGTGVTLLRLEEV